MARADGTVVLRCRLAVRLRRSFGDVARADFFVRFLSRPHGVSDATPWLGQCSRWLHPNRAPRLNLDNLASDSALTARYPVCSGIGPPRAVLEQSQAVRTGLAELPRRIWLATAGPDEVIRSSLRRREAALHVDNRRQEPGGFRPGIHGAGDALQ